MTDAGGDKGPPAEGSFDLEAAIAQFVSDGSRTELMLPTSLTAEQRKTAKRLAEKHPELKCESYGMGAERQMHLFKRQLAPSPTSGAAGEDAQVRVKNTFIDDWVGGEGDGENAADPAVYRSAPVALLQRTLQRCIAEGGDQTQQADLAELARVLEEDKRQASASASGSSPLAPIDDAASDVGSGAPLSDLPEMPKLPKDLMKASRQVKNTFISIEQVPVVERVVQSMPHGMFSACLQQELESQRALEAQAAAERGDSDPAYAPQAPLAASHPPPPPVAPAPAVLAPAQPPPTCSGDQPLVPVGTEVEIQGLVKLPDFNGLTGVVQAWDQPTGRYDILLDLAAGSAGWRWVKVKGENIRQRAPPPPRSAPTLLLDDCIPAGSEDGEAVGELPKDIPNTPKWDDIPQVVGDPAGRGATPLTLNALV